MARILLSDYFAENNGANDDSADCTASFNAALAALVAEGGGFLELPSSGACRIAGNVNLGFSQVPIHVEGKGGYIKFVGSGSAKRFCISTDSNQLTFENVFCLSGVPGTTGAASDYDAIENVFLLRARSIYFRNCNFYALGVAGEGSGFGVIGLYSANAHLENCNFDGCSAPASGVIRTVYANSLSLKFCSFLDHATIGAEGYSKTPSGIMAWILADSFNPETAASQIRRLSVDECFFDEGSTSAIICNGGTMIDKVSIRGCGINIGAGNAIQLNSVRDARISQTFIGYYPTGNRVGIYAGFCDFVKLEGVRFGKAVNHVEVFKTKRFVVENCVLQGNPTYPNGVKDSGSNGIIEVDGVKYKNGMIQY